MKNKNLSNKNGITLIALIITIIVMLILVAVTISMAVNGGLFGYAGNAARQTEEEKNKEMKLANVEGNLTTDQLISYYTNGNNNDTVTWTIINDADSNNIVSVGDEVRASTGENFFVIAKDSSIVTLLSKYNLATSKNESGKYYQQTSNINETGCAFSSSPYWTTSNINTDPGTYAEGDAIEKARTYGIQNGGTGRLLTCSEASSLKSSWPEAFTFQVSGYLIDYWLGDEATTSDDEMAPYYLATVRR